MSLNNAELDIKLSIRDQVNASANVQSVIPVNIDSVSSSVYVSGTTANCVNKSAFYSTTLVASTLNIDLSTLPCSDGSVGFSHVRLIFVNNLETTDGNTLLAGNTGTNGFVACFAGATERVSIEASGQWVAQKQLGTTGWVVDSTLKLIKLDSGSNSVHFEVYILGD